MKLIDNYTDYFYTGYLFHFFPPLWDHCTHNAAEGNREKNRPHVTTFIF